jgi:hypothetical protein
MPVMNRSIIFGVKHKISPGKLWRKNIKMYIGQSRCEKDVWIKVNRDTVNIVKGTKFKNINT